jgi:hypothetical protein
LAAMLPPALRKARQKATAVACLNNVKQLAPAWIMYSDDNHDLLVNLSTYTGSTAPLNDGVSWRTDLYNGLKNGELSPCPCASGRCHCQHRLVLLNKFRQHRFVKGLF